MAPNLKSTRHLSLLDLSTLNTQPLSKAVSAHDLGFLNESEFPPLTSSIENDHTEEAEQQTTNNNKAVDYWGWDEPDQDIVEEEKKLAAAEPVSYWDWETPNDEVEQIDVLSLANIESNLIQAANELNNKESSTQEAANDAYWAEDSDHIVIETQPVKPQHEISYWDWHTEEEKVSIVKAIGVMQKVQEVITASIEKSLYPSQAYVTTSNPLPSNDPYWSWESPVYAPHVDDDSHPRQSYWDWNAEPTSLTQQILEYESARLMLCADHVESMLQKEASDNYWKWSASNSDNYWDWKSQPIETGSDNYWKW